MSETNPLHIRLSRGNSNESGAALNVTHNKNMAIIESAINRLFDVITTTAENTAVNFDRVLFKASANGTEGQFFTISKNVSATKAEFVITAKEPDKFDLRNAIVQIRDFYNDVVLVPQKLEKDSIKITIDNVDDVIVTNASNPDFDTNNLTFFIVQFNIL